MSDKGVEKPEYNSVEETRSAPGKVRMPSMKIDRVQQLKDVAKLSIMKPVASRMRTRYKEILEMSRAKSSKIMKGGQPVWTTINPEMFISGLKLVTKNGVGTITYHRYELNEAGNKKAKVHYKKVRNSLGDMVEVEVSMSYIHECLVVETIAYMKPLAVEEIKEFV